MRAVLGAQRVGVGDQRALRHAVGGAERQAEERHARADEHDAARGDSTSASIAAAVTRQAPSRLTSSIRRTCSPGGSPALAGPPMPALLTSASRPPPSRSIAARTAAGDRLRRRSRRRRARRRRRSRRRSRPDDLPAARAQRGDAAPMPNAPLAPVTSARRLTPRSPRRSRAAASSSLAELVHVARRSRRASSGRPCVAPALQGAPAAALGVGAHLGSATAAPSGRSGARRAAATGARGSGTPSRSTASARRRTGRRASRWKMRL